MILSYKQQMRDVAYYKKERGYVTQPLSKYVEITDSSGMSREV